MSILIVSHYGDVHAEAVRWGLKAVGVAADIWMPSDVPSFGEVAVAIDKQGFDFTGSGLTRPIRDYQLAWLRKPGRFSPDIRRTPGENRYVEYESRQMLHGVLYALEETLPVTNRFSREIVSANKIKQLIIAQKVGLQIPMSVVGNRGSDISAAFLGKRPAYKSFRVPIWRGSDLITERGAKPQATVGATSRIADEFLDRPDVIQSCPGIFQEYVAKSHELRILWLEGRCTVARIDSQSSAEAKEDWRLDQKNLNFQPDTIPDDVAQRLGKLMIALGLEGGSIDMIVTPEGQHIFLEVNPSGQFLWLDRLDNRFHTLGEAVSYLAAKAGYARQPKDVPPYSDFERSSDFVSYKKALEATRFAMHTDYSYADEQPIAAE